MMFTYRSVASPMQIPPFFDTEVDPMRDHCYLHGFAERLRGDIDGERFAAFFADEATEEAEREALAGAWAYMQGSQPCVIYYF